MAYGVMSWILVNIVSGNGLMPGGTKPLPEPMLTNHQCDPAPKDNGNRNAQEKNHYNTFENC